MDPSAIVGLVALILVSLITGSTFYGLFKVVESRINANSPEDSHDLYADGDGEATEDSQKAFSVAVPQYIALSSCIVGLAAATAGAVKVSVETERTNLLVENWSIFFCWVRIRGQFLYYHDAKNHCRYY